jgi:hypothetical protein
MDSANVSIILQSAHEEAEKIRAYSDFDLLALVAGSSGSAASPVVAKAPAQEKPAMQPRKAGVKAVVKVAATAKKSRDGSAPDVMEAWLKANGEAGAGAIMKGTGLSRSAFGSAQKALRKRGTVEAHGKTKRDKTYVYVGE